MSYPKGNFLIGQQKNGSAAANSSYCSVNNGNTKQEHVELDVSKIIGRTVAVKGSIMMYFGSTLPKGWVLCDGNNGTPNLVDMFIEATTTKPKTTGGSNDIVEIAHTHTISFGAVGNHTHTGDPASGNTNTAGEHTHRDEISSENNQRVGSRKCYAVSGLGSHIDWMAFHSGHGSTRPTSSTGDHTHTLDPGVYTSQSASSHTHTVTIAKYGSKSSNLNMPPYYSLVYIQKT